MRKLPVPVNLVIASGFIFFQFFRWFSGLGSCINSQLPVQVDHGQLPVQVDHGQLPVQVDHGQLPVQIGHGQLPVQIDHGQLLVNVDHGQLPIQIGPSATGSRRRVSARRSSPTSCGSFRFR
jgi:hypothetical protein